MKVYVARHGETTWNVEGRYQGRLESPLSELGGRQSEALANAMSPLGLGRVVSSPLGRCVATAEPAAARARLPVERDPRLIEIAHGSWEGRLRDELAANDPQRYHAWRNDPAHVAFEDGETLAQVRDRWRAFAASFQPEAPALVVTHDAVVRVALTDARGEGLEAFWNARVENGAYAIFEVDGGTWTLLEACVTAHLEGLRADTARQAL